MVSLRPKSSIQFAEKHVRLDGNRFDRTAFPLMVEPLNVIDGALNKTVLLIGSIQSFKTLTAQLATIRDAYVDGATTGYFFPTINDIEDFSEDKFTPLWEDTVPCRRIESDNKHHKTKDRIILPHMVLRLLNAGSKGNRNSKTMERQVCDEAWMYEPGHLGEIEGRLTSFRYTKRRVIPSSGPTAGSELDDLWIQSDQREWHWVCPDCGKAFIPDWLPARDDDGNRPPGGLRYAEDEEGQLLDGSIDWMALRKSVYYECHNPECRSHMRYAPNLLDHLNQSGFYQAQNANPDPQLIAFHWWAIVHMDWADLVVQWKKALLAKDRGSLEPLEDFVRKRRAKSWDVSVWTRPLAKGAGKGKYPLGGDWGDEWKDAVRLMTIDVQKDHFWAVIRAWTLINGKLRTRLVYSGRVESSGHLRDLQEAYNVPDHGGMYEEAPCNVFIDGNYNPREVERLAAHYNWYVLRGGSTGKFRHKDGIHRITSELQYVDVYQGTATSGQRYAGVLKYSSEDARNVLANLRGLEEDDEPVWSFAEDASADYLEQIDSWYRIAKKRSDGAIVYQWFRRGSTPDHLFDDEVMNAAAAELAGFVGVEA